MSFRAQRGIPARPHSLTQFQRHFGLALHWTKANPGHFAAGIGQPLKAKAPPHLREEPVSYRVNAPYSPRQGVPSGNRRDVLNWLAMNAKIVFRFEDVIAVPTQPPLPDVVLSEKNWLDVEAIAFIVVHGL